ncbi:MAG TPA: class I SAM-dependent RNA methyltransferase [Verrucomicrobiae bacterium]|nr:class I SAM-dependent RNA methyltransferase [Verrucomicrobiae bacterium]
MGTASGGPSASHECVITIDRLGGQGDGIAMAEGQTVYVAYGVPGDRLRIRLGKPRGQGLTAAILAVEQAGPARQEPPCAHFGRCGGCALQHVVDALYAEWKRGRVVEALRQQGLGEVPVEPLVRTPAGSRRRITLAAQVAKGGAVLGFHAHESHDIVDLRECHVMLPALAALIAPLREMLGRELRAGTKAEVMATVSATGIDLMVRADYQPGRDSRVALADFAGAQKLARISWQAGKEEPEPIALLRTPQVLFGGVAVDPPPGAFLQASAEAEQAMIDLVAAAAGGAKRVADLYSGCGTFTFPLAKTAKVHAVEGDKDSLAALAAAARRGSLGRITSERRDLARNPLQPDELKPFDCVVFDPPRAGARAQVEMLAKSRVPTVVAVSCDPGSFARDSRILVDSGYRLKSVTPIDQFVWSAHVEMVAVFRR